MFTLEITPGDLQAAQEHAAASYPEECCGFLIGRFDAGTGTTVLRVLPVSNERQESRHNRYLISPETVLAANKEARALGLDVVGYYHSHPDHPARPSAFAEPASRPWLRSGSAASRSPRPDGWSPPRAAPPSPLSPRTRSA